ncbi:T9SS type A sorting domain-containing protein, partial [Ferruginibacter yonginensis]
NINSATVKVAAVVTATKQGVSIYPNPVVGDNINVHFNGQPLGEYQISIYNAVGQMLHQQTLKINNNQQLTTITIPHLATGSYELKWVGADAKINTVPFMK